MKPAMVLVTPRSASRKAPDPTSSTSAIGVNGKLAGFDLLLAASIFDEFRGEFRALAGGEPP
jgi:hypothetical protein